MPKGGEFVRTIAEERSKSEHYLGKVDPWGDSRMEFVKMKNNRKKGTCEVRRYVW